MSLVFGGAGADDMIRVVDGRNFGRLVERWLLSADVLRRIFILVYSQTVTTNALTTTVRNKLQE